MRKYTSLHDFKKSINLKKKFEIYLFIVDQKISMRLIVETFRHFTKIVDRVFNEIFQIMNTLYLIFVKFFTSRTSFAKILRQNNKF